MIADKDTNFVYFSDLLRTNYEYSSTCSKITEILDKHIVGYDFLKGTKDIWARDYMPIQIDSMKFIQFRYEPSYLDALVNIRSDPKVVCNLNTINPTFSEINMDGGNIVKWTDKLLITDRIFAENKNYKNTNQLVKEIESLLETEVIIIPQIKSDFTGHADGLVKIIDSETLLGNDLDFEFKYWSKGMSKIISEKKFKYHNMPMFEFKEKGYPDSAIGCYINYLEVGNLIVFPIFEVDGNKDIEAIDLITMLYPKHKIEPININPIARNGGLMNCISWNIKKI